MPVWGVLLTKEECDCGEGYDLSYFILAGFPPFWGPSFPREDPGYAHGIGGVGKYVHEAACGESE